MLSLLQSGLTTTEDNFKVSENNYVFFSCPNKGNVKVLISGEFQSQITSHWQSLFGGASTGSAVVDTLDSALGLFSGNSIRQPWFGRSSWKGTDPMSFTIPIQLIAIRDAKTEVYDPFVRLASYFFPRVGIDSPSPVVANYIIPGPSVWYNSNKADNDGDPVEIRVGSMFTFKGCYLTSFNFNIKPQFTNEGWPMYITGSVSFTSMDNCFVKSDGSFMTEGFDMMSSFDVQNFFDDIKATGGELLSQGASKIKGLLGL